MQTKVAVIVGSLRQASLSRRLARALEQIAPVHMNLEEVAIGALPWYNQDLENNFDTPSAWVEFRRQIVASDAVLFITPEYNRSVPGVLKNAIDVGSRPSGQGAWSGKPAAVISITPGALGGFGANHHLRQSLVSVNMHAMAQPEAYIGGAASMFSEDNDITNATTKEFLTKFLSAFASWIDRTRADVS